MTELTINLPWPPKTPGTYRIEDRVRDLDNLWKSALDVLKHNAVITDDGHIDDLHVRRATR